MGTHAMLCPPNLNSTVLDYLKKEKISTGAGKVVATDAVGETLSGERSLSETRSYVLRGRPDLVIDRNDDGRTLIIVDYKLTPDIKLYARNSQIVTNSYAWLTFINNDVAENVIVVFLGLNRDGKPYSNVNFKFNKPEAILAMSVVDESAANFFEHKSRSDFRANTGEGCRHCGGIDSCPEGRAFVQRPKPPANSWKN